MIVVIHGLFQFQSRITVDHPLSFIVEHRRVLLFFVQSLLVNENLILKHPKYVQSTVKCQG